MKHSANRRSVSSKTFVVMLALVLALGCAVGGTIAWLTKTTDPVINTFTYGNIDITLTETERTYKIVPGQKIDKDPKVTVVGGSEACWLFVKVEEKDWPTFTDGSNRKVSYAIDTANWTLVPGETKVYYHKVDATAAQTGVAFNVLAGDQVTVSDTLTKTEIERVKDTTPTLTFTAYAIQQEGFADVAKAWEEVSKPATPVAP